MAPAQLITTYLEMLRQDAFIPAYCADPAVQVRPVKHITADIYRQLYRGVGGQWGWRDRDVWSDEQLENWLAQPHIHLSILYIGEEIGGYIELEEHPEGVQIAYFGIFESFYGRGYGKHLLSVAIQQAWDLGAARIWLHTCNLDSPQALPNYQARGFKTYKVETEPMPARYVE